MTKCGGNSKQISIDDNRLILHVGLVCDHVFTFEDISRIAYRFRDDKNILLILMSKDSSTNKGSDTELKFYNITHNQNIEYECYPHFTRTLLTQLQKHNIIVKDIPDSLILAERIKNYKTVVCPFFHGWDISDKQDELEEAEYLRSKQIYTLHFTDHHGHALTNYGLTQKIGADDAFVKKEFLDLKRAKSYTNAFIRRYPQAIVSIYRGDTKIETIQNEEYRAWKETNNKEWHEVYKKADNLRRIMTVILLVISVSLVTLLEHWLSLNNFSLWEKMLISPLVFIVSWWIIQFIIRKSGRFGTTKHQ